MFIAEGIVVHNTANDASARNEADYMERNDNQVSFHMVVDDKEALKLIPFNRNSWHAGGSGKGNRKYLALEICYSKSGGSRFVKAEDNAAKVVASILKEKGWGIDKVKAHRDFAKKNCPHRTDMKAFKDKVAKYLKGNSNPSPSNNLKEGDRVTIIESTLKYATGQEITSWAKKQTHTIDTIKGDRALLKEIKSWCYLKDLKGTTNKKKLTVGMYVKVNGIKYATGQTIPDWVKKNKYKVIQLKSDRALLENIMSWVYKKDLIY